MSKAADPVAEGEPVAQSGAGGRSLLEDDCPLPWRVDGDSAEQPPMIWDAKGDSIVNQMEDGRPYFEPEVAALIVKACNSYREPAEPLDAIILDAVQRCNPTTDGERFCLYNVIESACNKFAAHVTKGLEARLAELTEMKSAGVGNYVHSREGCPFMYCDQEAPFTACKEKCRHAG